MKKKILSILLIALLALTACGKKEDAIPNSKTEGTSENSVKPDSNSNNDFKELQIVESVHATEDDNFSYTYSVIIENPNSDYEVTLPRYKVEAFDENNKSITHYEQLLPYMGPNDRIAFSSAVITKDTKAAKIEFTIINDPIEYVKSTSFNNKDSFTFENTNETKDQNSTVIVGDVISNLPNDQDQIAITVLLRKDGKIIHGHTSFIHGVRSGEATPFEAKTYSDIDYDTYELSAMIW